jgi:protein TonB
MPRDLFGQMTRPFDGVGARSRLTVPVSLAGHALAVVGVVVAPLLASDALPVLHSSLSLEMVTPVVLPAPPLRRVAPPPDAPVVAAMVPLYAPEGIAPKPTVEPVDTSTADLGVITGEITSADALVPPPDTPPPPRREPVRVGGAIQPPTKVHHVAPVYPAIALAVGVQGMAIISATISVDGEVTDTVVLKAHPLLAQAAVDAVQQWRFTPTRLNGEPVPVVMTVTVNFQLR